jgi:protein-S-isoprenylcysteine O-methyltransferase Ste14
MVASTWITPGSVQFLENRKRFHTAMTRTVHSARLELSSSNPLYVAGTMLVLGIGLVSGIVWFLLLANLAAFTVQKLAIEREERRLQARFGETYLDYARRVRRWI